MRRDETARCEGPVQQEPGDELALCPVWRALLYVTLFQVAAVGLAGCAAYCASPGSNFVEPTRAPTEQAAAPAGVSVADQIRAIDERLRKIESLVAGERDQEPVARVPEPLPGDGGLPGRDLDGLPRAGEPGIDEDEQLGGRQRLGQLGGY